jgi:hypothetical protein
MRSSCLAAPAPDRAARSIAFASRRLVPLAALVVAALACQRSGEPSGAAASASAATASAPSPSGSAAVLNPGAATGATTATGKAAPPKADPSRLKLKGKAIQGGLVQANVEKGTRGIKFPGHKVVISEEGDFLIAFFRNAPPKETIEITFPDGAVLEHVFEVEQRTYEKDVINGLPERWVKLDVATRKKLHQANQRIEAVRNRYTKKAHYQHGFCWPVKGRITSRYGQPRVLNGVDSGVHWGVDIASPVGTPVRAPAGGTVVFAETNVPLSGHVLIIDHGHGLSSSFLHLSTFAKKVGDEVAQDDVVARVGMTGRANGPHLDWRMNYFKIRIDPELLAPPMADAAAERAEEQPSKTTP